MERLIASIFVAVVMVLAAPAVYSQKFPNRPIRIIVSEAGSVNDLYVRLIAEGISGPLGQPVIAENRASVLFVERVANAPPDGHTMAFGAGVLYLAPVTQKVAYEPLTPVSWVSTSPYILAMHPSVPAKSVKELIDLAKAKPGVLNAGASNDPGSSSLLGVELLKATAGVNIVRVSYKGAGPGLIGLLANEVQLYFLAPGGVMTHVRSGKLTGLAVTSLEPSPLVPGMPTLSASGLPGFELIAVTGLMAPPKTPAPIVNQLSQEIARFLRRPETKAAFLKYEAESVGSTSEEFAAKIKSEIVKWGKVLKDAGIKVGE